jgi:hypothetical protein
MDNTPLRSFVKVRCQGFQLSFNSHFIICSHRAEKSLLAALQTGQNAFVSEGALVCLSRSFGSGSRICHNIRVQDRTQKLPPHSDESNAKKATCGKPELLTSVGKGF